MTIPRIAISALRGGSGKTVLSIGIIASLKELGFAVVPFKKGPDYIDAGWLAQAAGRPCHNLDTFLVDPASTKASFCAHATGDSVAVIEGNRGLFDSMDLDGSTSTAELAKLLNCPVVLILDCTKTTRTLAALVLGCLHFDPDLDLRAAILNRVANARHEQKIRKSLAHYTGVPVIGAVPNLSDKDFPERHMGLVPTPEHDWTLGAIGRAGAMAGRYIDMQALFEIAASPKVADIAAESACQEMDDAYSSIFPVSVPKAARPPRVGVARDSAFQFYYPENIEALSRAGAQVIPFSLVDGSQIPEMDALYLGGGFPETHAGLLANNESARERIRSMALAGMPIYAECGGLMYLCRELILDSGVYPMAGVIPATVGVEKRPVGHGYTVVKADAENPFYSTGEKIKGHEFHYSRILSLDESEIKTVFAVTRGRGAWQGRDGLCIHNVLATYMHIHALGTPSWAPALVRRAMAFQKP
ncbi:MAG: cobyrinate a,c-diamide synthase [Desulfatibacillaceae bacterium]|nr:cobyrinate a,c-diamide synthase [Desulfatibacillaceae bacterium]